MDLRAHEDNKTFSYNQILHWKHTLTFTKYFNSCHDPFLGARNYIDISLFILSVQEAYFVCGTPNESSINIPNRTSQYDMSIWLLFYLYSQTV